MIMEIYFGAIRGQNNYASAKGDSIYKTILYLKLFRQSTKLRVIKVLLIQNWIDFKLN